MRRALRRIELPFKRLTLEMVHLVRDPFIKPVRMEACILDQKQVRKEKETADLLQNFSDSSADPNCPTTQSSPATPSPPTTNHVTTQSVRQTQRQAALDRIRAMLLRR